MHMHRSSVSWRSRHPPSVRYRIVLLILDVIALYRNVFNFPSVLLILHFTFAYPLHVLSYL